MPNDKEQHDAPCAYMKAILVVMSTFILVAGIWGGVIQASVSDAREETEKTILLLTEKIERMDVDGRRGAIATSRIEEQLKAVRESLLRIERELERRDTPPL